MRPPVDADGIGRLAQRLGRAASVRTRMYLTGGATAVIEGWRAATLDVDVRFEPEADELLRELAHCKEALDVNVELASPPDFVPELPDWRLRSPLVTRTGMLDVHHFDLYSQALSKLERGFAHDLEDVREMVARGMVAPARLVELYSSVEDQLYRYPAIEGSALRRRVHELAG